MTRREAHRQALHYAICERDSLVDAYAGLPDDPAAVRARYQAEEFRRVLREEFGEITAEDDFTAQKHPSVSIFELAAALATPETKETGR